MARTNLRDLLLPHAAHRRLFCLLLQPVALLRLHAQPEQSLEPRDEVVIHGAAAGRGAQVEVVRVGVDVGVRGVERRRLRVVLVRQGGEGSGGGRGGRLGRGRALPRGCRAEKKESLIAVSGTLP